MTQAPVFTCPPWRKPATAFAFLNFAEDAEDITGSARAVLYALAKHCKWKKGRSKLYLDELAAKAGLRCNRATQRAVDELVRLGVLEVEDGEKEPRQQVPPRRIYRLILPVGYLADPTVPTSASYRS